MKKLRFYLIIALLIIAAISYQTNSPVVGAAICGTLLGIYAGVWIGAGIVLARFRHRLPQELMDAISSNDTSVHVRVKAVNTAKDKEEALKEFNEMIARHEQERKSKG